jgi:hypothetical protein
MEGQEQKDASSFFLLMAVCFLPTIFSAQQSCQSVWVERNVVYLFACLVKDYF